MRLTNYTDYSLRVLIALALRPDELTTIAQIARMYRISEHHLMKVAHQLGVAGFIETVRGRGGGLRLAAEPSQINVGDVVRRMEPDLGLVSCFRQEESCRIASVCSLAGVLDRALNAFMEVLNRSTLADLIGRPQDLSALLEIKPAGPANAFR